VQNKDMQFGMSLEKIKGASILLVEDNEFNQEVAVGLLEGGELNIDIANNGQEAIDMIARKHYDLVLMDIQMPVMDGLTATREIRKNERFRQLPILAMTANAMQQDKEKSFAAGMNGHLAKPIDPDELFSALLKWIKKDSIEAASSESNAEIKLTEMQYDDGIPMLDGLDYKQGLKRVLGKTQRYLEMLLKYVVSQEKLIEELTIAMTNHDMRSAERFAHTSKSINGNVGALKLQEQAAELEKMFREQSDPQSLKSRLDSYTTELLTMMNAIRKSIPAASVNVPASTSSISQAKSLEALARLKTLLKNDDSAAIDYLEEHQSTFNALLGNEFFIKFSRCIRSYDFGAAVVMLDS
jgi:two-component system sensor histidine kinase/response regulator